MELRRACLDRSVIVLIFFAAAVQCLPLRPIDSKISLPCATFNEISMIGGVGAVLRLRSNISDHAQEDASALLESMMSTCRQLCRPGSAIL